MSESRPTLAIGGIRYETNSFAPPGSLDLTSLRTGDDVLDALESTEVAGAVREAAGHDVELIGLLDVFGGCGGPVDHQQYDRLARELVARLAAGPTPDGVYLALHGAMTTARTDAVEADLVRRVREVVGADVPVVASFDLHAAVDHELASLLDGVVGFKTCPHVDYEETGASALRMLVEAVCGSPIGVRHAAIPMITAAEPHDTNDGPLASHMAAVLARCGGDLVDVSIFAVQPWLDTARTSWAVTVTYRAPGGAAHAEAVADEVRDVLVADSAAFAVVKTAPDEVPRLVRTGVKRPLLLADSGDSPSAGATGASTDLLGRLLDTGDATVLATVTDASVARRLAAVPVGQTEPVSLGGVPSLGIDPLELDVVIRSVHDGRFERAYPAAEVDAGVCVVVGHRNLTIVVTERPVFMLDTSVFDHVGVDPAAFDAVQVKSAGGFRALWSSISTNSVAVGTRGASTSELATLPYAAAPVEYFVLP